MSGARPYFGAIMLALSLMVAAGLHAIATSPAGIYPEVAFPRIVVVGQVAGLSVRDAEVAATRPLEEACGLVPGVTRVRSKTVRGAVEISIDFSTGTDMIQAQNDIRARIADIQSQLPAGTSLVVERQTPSVFPVISFAITGGTDPSALNDYARLVLKPRLSRIPDVSMVTVQGGDTREILVEAEPGRLAAAGLSIADLATALEKEVVLKSLGRIERGTRQVQILTDTQTADLAALGRIVVHRAGEAVFRVQDLARISIFHEDRAMAIRSAQRDAVALTLFRRPGGNILAVSHAFDEVLAQEERAAPPGVRFVRVYDQGELVRTSVYNVRDAILIGGALSILVLLLFLKDLVATAIASLAIPLSLVIAFVPLKLTGETLNLMSLGGLAVAIGLIIDDTVVVIESIARHLSHDQRGDEAVNRASREIAGAVIGSTLTTILVFVPLIFAGGTTGQFFRSLSLSLSLSLLISMIISLTVIPVLAARYIAHRGMAPSGALYERLARAYEAVLAFCLRWPRVCLIASLAVMVPGFMLGRELKTGFMPEMEEGAFVLDYEMPVGTALEQTDRVLRRVEEVLVGVPDVAAYIRRTGAELGFFATEAYTGDVLVSLKPADQRRSNAVIFADVRERLEKAVPGLAVEVIPLVQDQISDLSGAGDPIEVKVFGPDVTALRKHAAELGEALGKIPGIADLNTHVQAGNSDLVVKPLGLAAAAGLTATDLADQVSAALRGREVGHVPESDRLTTIRVRYPDRIRLDPARLARIPIRLPSPSSSGPAALMLSQVARTTVEHSANASWRENLQPVITISAQIEGHDLGAVVDGIKRVVAAAHLPSGYRVELAGDYLAQQESFASLTRVLVVAALLVFLLLAFQFKSLVKPILIFLAQPLSLTSAIIALHVTGTPLNVSSLMGAILLVGLDVKNGILLVESIDQHLEQGLPLQEALLVAGRERFRPILMTSLTAIFGLVPLAMGWGPGAQMQRPLAIAVIGGLTANMLFTRLVLPVGYELMVRARE